MKILILIALLVGFSSAGLVKKDAKKDPKRDKFDAFKLARKRKYSNSGEENSRFNIYSQNLDYIQKVNSEKKPYSLAEFGDLDLTVQEIVTKFTGAQFIRRRSKPTRKTNQKTSVKSTTKTTTTSTRTTTTTFKTTTTTATTTSTTAIADTTITTTETTTTTSLDSNNFTLNTTLAEGISTDTSISSTDTTTIFTTTTISTTTSTTSTSTTTTTTTISTTSTYIDQVNWVDKGFVGSVKNQGSCGSCWAFAANSVVESHVAIKYNQPILDLSEQNLVDCSSTFGNHGCSGGWMTNAFDYIISNQGINSEAVYPYKAFDQTCQYKSGFVATTIQDYVELPSDEKALESAVRNNGPVTVAIDANIDFIYYRSGILSGINCSQTTVNHAVVVVGFNNSASTPYWIVRNSWGTGWGENGYVRMAKGRNLCGIANYASYPIA